MKYTKFALLIITFCSLFNYNKTVVSQV